MQTRVDEIGDGLFRISTSFPPSAMPGGFTFNQFLIRDEAPLLYHTGMRALFPQVSAAVERVLPLRSLRRVACSHFESDECGALNEFLAAAPDAEPLCGDVAAAVSLADFANRPPRVLQDGEELDLGRHRVRWIATPHLPHAWECGHLFESATATLLCGDLFTQGGHEHPPVTEDDLIGPSEALMQQFDYFSYTRRAGALIEKLAALRPGTLACMHGASWNGDGAAMLRALGRSLMRSE